MSRVLVMGAEVAFRAALAEYLRLESHEVKQLAAFRGAQEVLKKYRPNLIIVDDGDSGSGGFPFCRDVRVTSQVPLILISDRNTESDRVTALEIGVDDYLAKPVSPREIVLRVKALLRRSVGHDFGREEIWYASGRMMQLDLMSHRILVDGDRIRLTAAEWKVFTFLVHEGGAVVSRERILEGCFQYSVEVYDRVVDTHVKNLRAKLGSPDWIETVKGFGYRFAGERVAADVALA